MHQSDNGDLHTLTMSFKDLFLSNTHKKDPTQFFLSDTHTNTHTHSSLKNSLPPCHSLYPLNPLHPLRTLKHAFIHVDTGLTRVVGRPLYGPVGARLSSFHRAIITSALNDALYFGNAKVGYMYGAATDVDTNADAMLTITMSTITAFLYQLSLFNLYAMLAGHQIYMCQTNGVLAVMDASGFKLRIQSAGESTAAGPGPGPWRLGGYRRRRRPVPHRRRRDFSELSQRERRDHRVQGRLDPPEHVQSPFAAPDRPDFACHGRGHRVRHGGPHVVRGDPDGAGKTRFSCFFPRYI